MPWRVATAYPEYLYQLGALLRDPVYHGAKIPTGHGQPVLLIPGFLAGDWTLMRMAGWLNRLGYQSYFSGINWNVECPNKTGQMLRWRLEHLAKEVDPPFIVIGHSLGGMLARFLGVNFPDYIHHVIALGSPIDPRALRVHPLVPFTFQVLQKLRQRLDATTPQCGSPACACHFGQSFFAPLPETVGFTSIFTKRDEVVDWRACLDERGDNRQVSGGHLSLAVNHEVYRILAELLASLLVRNDTTQEASANVEDR